MSKDASYPDDVALCHQMLREQQATIAQVQREVESLKHYLARLLRDRYGPRNEQLDPRQGLLFDTDQAVDEPEPEQPRQERTETRQRRKRGEGQPKISEHVPVERLEVDLPEHEKCCPECGKQREQIGQEVRRELEMIPPVVKLLEHVRPKYACRHCEGQVASMSFPPRPLAGSLPGPGLLATLVVSKYVDHVPLYRFEDILARHQVEIGRNTLCRWVLAVAKLLTPLYDLMVSRVRSSRAIWTDDTPVPVQEKGRGSTRTGRFWVYVGDASNPYTVYDYTTSRKRDGPQRFLEKFSGYLQADAFAGYDGIYATGKVQQVLCWAHARRKFFEAREVQPTEAHAALAYIAELYAVESEARERGLDHTERCALRQEKSTPRLAQFHEWLIATESNVLPKSPVGLAINYVLPRWDGLCRYTTDGELTIDNNLSERMIRPCTLGRKNWLFLGSDRGGAAAAVLYSLMASCKVHQVEPFAWLRDVLTELPQHSVGSDLSELLPDLWLPAHPTAHRRWPH